MPSTSAPQLGMMPKLDHCTINPVSIQFNGGGNATLTFIIGGNYYKILSISPYFKPVEDDAVLLGGVSEQYEVSLRARREFLEEHRVVKRHLPLPQLCELHLIEALLAASSPFNAVKGWGLICFRNSIDGDDTDIRVYEWRKAFAEAWRLIDALATSSS